MMPTLNLTSKTGCKGYVPAGYTLTKTPINTCKGGYLFINQTIYNSNFTTCILNRSWSNATEHWTFSPI